MHFATNIPLYEEEKPCLFPNYFTYLYLRFWLFNIKMCGQYFFMNVSKSY